MSALRDMLDSPANHPGLFRAVQAGDIKAGGPGSGRRPGGGSGKEYTHQDVVDALRNKGFRMNNRYAGSGEQGFGHKDGRQYNVDVKTGSWDYGKGSDPWSNKTANDGQDRDSLMSHIARH